MLPAFLLSVQNFANNLDPDQDRRKVGPDLDPNCLTLFLSLSTGLIGTDHYAG